MDVRNEIVELDLSSMAPPYNEEDEFRKTEFLIVALEEPSILMDPPIEAVVSKNTKTRSKIIRMNLRKTDLLLVKVLEVSESEEFLIAEIAPPFLLASQRIKTQFEIVLLLNCAISNAPPLLARFPTNTNINIQSSTNF